MQQPAHLPPEMMPRLVAHAKGVPVVPLPLPPPPPGPAALLALGPLLLLPATMRDQVNS